MVKHAPMPHPFLKWAGGKRSLLKEILPRLPEEIEHYIEPFLGGGAVFFALFRERRFKRATLSDRNPALIHAWRMVQAEVEAVIESIGQWEPVEEVFYEVRALDPSELSAVDRAARLLWLNRTCFNGLYRINRKGQFNVPFGRYAKPRLVDRDNLRRCSEALQSTELIVGDFDQAMSLAGPGDVVYCDPPYWPVSATSRFTAYDGHPFKEADQNRLDKAFRALSARGTVGLLSNSNVAETRALYAGLQSCVVRVRRSINRDGDRRGQVEELLVRVPTLDRDS